MHKCKICGQTVLAGNTFHSACWKKTSNELAEKFCDDYCRWPRECPDEESLAEQHCSSCELIKVLNLGL